MEEKQASIITKLAQTLNVHENDLDFDRLMELMKEKIVVSKRADKLQVLTPLPTTWKAGENSVYFSVTRYKVKQSRRLQHSQEVFRKLTPRKGRSTSQETINMVTEFYCDDEYSRSMSGRKDLMSIKKNVHESKRF